MHRYVAFLRGMNLGGRRITNDELCRHIADLGFADVRAFLASGNVVLDSAEGDPKAVAVQIAEGLEAALAYAVPTFVRDAAAVRAIAAAAPFDPPAGVEGGKMQVAMLPAAPTPAARRKALALATDDDRLHIEGTELYWLPRGRLTDSVLDFKTLEGLVGPWSVRTHNTIVRLAKKHL